MPAPHHELLSLISRANQLIAETNEYLSDPESPYGRAVAKELRAMLVEMRARIEEPAAPYGGRE